MVRNTTERKKSDEEREQLLQQACQSPGLIDVVQRMLSEGEEDRQLLDALLEYIPEGITIASVADDKKRPGCLPRSGRPLGLLFGRGGRGTTRDPDRCA